MPKYVVVLEESTHDGHYNEYVHVRSEVGWFDDDEIAEAASIGIVTDKVARAKLEGQSWLGAAFVCRVGYKDVEREHLSGVDSSDVEALAESGLWIP